MGLNAMVVVVVVLLVVVVVVGVVIKCLRTTGHESPEGE